MVRRRRPSGSPVVLTFSQAAAPRRLYKLARRDATRRASVPFANLHRRRCSRSRSCSLVDETARRTSHRAVCFAVRRAGRLPFLAAGKFARRVASRRVASAKTTSRRPNAEERVCQARGHHKMAVGAAGRRLYEVRIASFKPPRPPPPRPRPRPAIQYLILLYSSTIGSFGSTP